MSEFLKTKVCKSNKAHSEANVVVIVYCLDNNFDSRNGDCCWSNGGTACVQLKKQVRINICQFKSIILNVFKCKYTIMSALTLFEMSICFPHKIRITIAVE